MIDINLLEYLVTFHKEGSLLKASESLNLSQLSLSKAMQKLEDELDLKIFDRKANKITLNQNGLELLDYANDILKMNERLEKKAKELKENEMTMSIGYTAPGPTYKYPNLFLSNTNTNKIISTLNTEDELIKGLINNSYDIIFINHDIKIDGCITKKLFQEHLYISVPPTHFICGMKAGVSWSDIDGQSFLLFSYVGYWETIVKNNLKRSRFLKNDDIEAMKEIAEFSSIPSFLTNLTINPNGVKNRINIPIINDSAYLNFYVVVKEKNKKILNLLHQ